VRSNPVLETRDAIPSARDHTRSRQGGPQAVHQFDTNPPEFRTRQIQLSGFCMTPIIGSMRTTGSGKRRDDPPPQTTGKATRALDQQRTSSASDNIRIAEGTDPITMISQGVPNDKRTPRMPWENSERTDTTRRRRRSKHGFARRKNQTAKPASSEKNTNSRDDCP